MIVDVLHPFPVEHIPPRARRARTTWFSATSHVDIPEAGAADFERFDIGLPRWHGWAGETSLYLREGKAYRKLELHHGRGALPPETFLSWLRGGAEPSPMTAPGREGPLVGSMQSEFIETPLVGRFPRPAGRGRTGLYPGRGVGRLDDRAAIGRVDRDGRNRSAASLARFASENLVITPAAVFRRYSPLASTGERHELVDIPTNMINLRYPIEHGMLAAVRADRADATARARGRAPVPPSQAMGRVLAAVPPTAFEDDDLRPFLSGAARTVGEYLRRGRAALAEAGLGLGARGDRILASVEALEVRAVTGDFDPEDRADAIDILRGAVTFHEGHEHGSLLRGDVRRETLAAFDGHLVWILESRLGHGIEALSEDDLAAIAAMR